MREIDSTNVFSCVPDPFQLGCGREEDDGWDEDGADRGARITAGLLAACDNGPSAVHARRDGPTAGTGEDGGSVAVSRDATATGVDHRKDPVRLVAGRPFWSASRRFSAEENASRAFQRNGQAFGARTEDEFVRKAHDFVDHPPAGTQTVTRANGDTLFYDPRGNVFAVAGKDGAPRTMFKPDGGPSYWQQQKDRESRRQAAGSDRRSRRSADDEA